MNQEGVIKRVLWELYIFQIILERHKNAVLQQKVDTHLQWEQTIFDKSLSDEESRVKEQYCFLKQKSLETSISFLEELIEATRLTRINLGQANHWEALPPLRKLISLLSRSEKNPSSFFKNLKKAESFILEKIPGG